MTIWDCRTHVRMTSMTSSVEQTDLDFKISVALVGMHPSEMMSSMRSHTSTAPASPTGFSISATIPDGLAALPDAILLMAFEIISKVMARLGLQLGFPLTGTG